MNILDLIFAIPIAWGIYSGYRKGLFIEIVGVCAFIVALVVGFKFLSAGMNFVSPFIGERLANRFLPYLSFSVIFFPTIFMMNRLGWMLRRALRFTILGTIDGTAGAIVGGFTWIFGISTMLWLCKTIGFGVPQHYAKDSFLLQPIETVSPTIISKSSEWIPAGGNIIKRLACGEEN